MPDDIVETFLGDPVQGGFYFKGELQVAALV
jgi:hypothetical protein